MGRGSSFSSSWEEEAVTGVRWPVPSRWERIRRADEPTFFISIFVSPSIAICPAGTPTPSLPQAVFDRLPHLRVTVALDNHSTKIILMNSTATTTSFIGYYLLAIGFTIAHDNSIKIILVDIIIPTYLLDII